MFDAEQRLVLANDRYAELYGHPPGELRPGMTLHQIIELRLARGLYPGMTAADVLTGMLRRAGGEQSSDRITRPGNGRELSVATQLLSTGGHVVTLHDISEQERLKKQLEDQNERLDAALNNMSQGLAMFDADQRLVVCNKVYGEMYGLTMEQLVPGTTLRQTLEYRFANGCYDVSDPGYVDTLIDNFGKRPTAIHRLADGRVIHVTYRRTASGGHVVTHEDITAREKLNAQLEQQNQLLKNHEEQLQARNVQLDAAINNMVQGLAMFDADQRLIVCNRLYAEMYGLTPEQVKPGTTVRQIFDYRLANGFYHVRIPSSSSTAGPATSAGDPRAFRSWRMAASSACRAPRRRTAAAWSRTRTSRRAKSSTRSWSSSIGWSRPTRRSCRRRTCSSTRR